MFYLVVTVYHVAFQKNKMKIIGYIKTHFWQLFRYGLVSLGGISFVFGVNYLLIGLLGIDPRLGNFITVTVAYAGMYFLSSALIFRQQVNVGSARSFAVYSVIFWSLNNLFFSLVYSVTRWNFLIITALNIMLLFPVRFFSQKYLVFKDF